MDVDLIERWTWALCESETARIDEVSRAIGVETGSAWRVGCQIICSPPEGVELFEYVMDLDARDDVVSVDFTLTEQMPLDHLQARFGPGVMTPLGPHQSSPTVMFDLIWPDEAPRACVLLADLGRDWPDEECVQRVSLCLRQPPADSEFYLPVEVLDEMTPAESESR
jgi:hypothetical protein